MRLNLLFRHISRACPTIIQYLCLHHLVYKKDFMTLLQKFSSRLEGTDSQVIILEARTLQNYQTIDTSLLAINGNLRALAFI